MIKGFENNPKLGYYKVGEEIFYSKPEAFMYATRTEQWPAWNFNTKEYAAVDWTQEPEANIRELYRLRAQQLRDRYDWIRVEASGGGDSTTAIFAFLLNGIHLDEVVFRYPDQCDKNVTDDPYNTNPENTLSERQFAAEPLFRWINTNFPKTKCTHHDYSTNLMNDDYMKDESWIFSTKEWFQPGHGVKHNHFGTLEHMAMADSGKKICSLYGVDKPKVMTIDGHWYTCFVDLQANHASPIVKDYDNITTELFYWTPDFPEISVKQAHMVKRWFDMPEHRGLKHLVTYPNINVSQRTAYEQVVKSIIYPDYDLETWQTAKPTNSFYNEMDHWFHVNLKDTELYHNWQAGLQYLTHKIDSKFFIHELGRPVGLMLSYSPFYYLGPAENNQTVPAFSNRDYHNKFSGEIVAVKDKKIKSLKL